MTGPRLAVAVQVAAEADSVPSRAAIRRWLAAALAGVRGEVTVRIVSLEESAELNSRYRQRRGATNVLAFPAGERLPIPEHETHPLGDLVICAAVVEREAREQGKAPDAHWAHMVIHGALHLHGYDHVAANEAAVMENRERELLAQFGYPDPYAARA